MGIVLLVLAVVFFAGTEVGEHMEKKKHEAKQEQIQDEQRD